MKRYATGRRDGDRIIKFGRHSSVQIDRPTQYDSSGHNTCAPECVYVLRSAALIQSGNYTWEMICCHAGSGCSGIGPWQHGEDGEVM